ncbi:MAG: DNA primase [Phototrophicaceae bacterium]
MSVTQQIKDRLDIVTYVQDHVPDLKKAGRYYKACCPFHSESTPSFVVNPDSQSWRCFGACAEGGDIFTFAQKVNGWDFAEALRELGQRAGVELKKRTPQQQAQDTRLDKLRGLLETAAKWYHEHLLSDNPKAEQALIYTIEQRGFNEQTIRNWEIGYAPDGWHTMLEALREIGYSDDDIVDAGMATRNDKGNVYDRFRNRLMIPIKDDRGRVVGFGARILDPEDSPKYLNSPQTPLFDKSQTLFGLDRAKNAIRDTDTAVIVEGYMDVIQAHQAGYENVIAQMGTAMTEAQLALIAPRHAKNIVMALDADDAGQNATRRSLEVARNALQADYMGKMSVDIRVLQIDDAKDPDDVLRETPEKWAEYIRLAMPVADFVIEMETADLDANASIAARQQIAQAILPILTATESNYLQKENVQKLALRLRIDETDLLDWARELERIQAAKKPKFTPPQPIAPQSDVPDKWDDNRPPPLLEDDYYQGNNSEEPPPFLGIDEEFAGSYAPDARDYDVPSAPHEVLPKLQLKPLSSRNASRATEAYCLRMLLLDPTTLAHVNRKLRELAGENQQLRKGPLRELCAEDFSQGDYRILLEALQAALRQDDADPLDYLREALDESLVDEIASLLLDEQENIHRRVGMRLEGEFDDIWKKYAPISRRSSDIKLDVISRMLMVRHQRLDREHQEVRFLLEDAQREHDEDSAKQYIEQLFPTMRALNLLHKELNQRTTAW